MDTVVDYLSDKIASKINVTGATSSKYQNQNGFTAVKEAANKIDKDDDTSSVKSDLTTEGGKNKKTSKFRLTKEKHKKTKRVH
jgi:hypothetical protein